MSLKDLSLLEAVELAVAMEEEGIRFYETAYSLVSDPVQKDLFAYLKEAEYSHINIFRKLHASLSASGGSPEAELYLLDPDIAAYFRAFVEATVFPVKGDAKKALAAVQSKADILQLGMRAEKDSILYYYELARQVNFPDGAEALEKIIAEEKKHFKALHSLWIEDIRRSG